MPEGLDPHKAMQLLTRRYQADPESLVAVLSPLMVPVRSLDKTVIKIDGQSHWRASFTVAITPESAGVIIRGRTGKFVPAAYGAGEWREIAKGRIINVDPKTGVAQGELYVGFGGNKRELEQALVQLDGGEFLEIDHYGVSAKLLSGLTQYYLLRLLQKSGYEIVRMPEDMAKHLGGYANYDFNVTKAGKTKKLEVKSLWGTNTSCARLIHSTTKRPIGPEADWTPQERANYYPTSSCKFATQDFFAVSLFLRTGQISDFAFARSVPLDKKPYGLRRVAGYAEHVTQNPACAVGNGCWFATLDEVWNLR